MSHDCANNDVAPIMLIAGFGDNTTMFEPLQNTELARQFRLEPYDLPGFGAPPLSGETTLDALALCVAERAASLEASIIIAHSVASIIASLAARLETCPLTRIVSLEGNITSEDAYFSGTASDYPDPLSFRSAFLPRLKAMGKKQPIIRRYLDAVSQASPQALWQLGCDARRFSENCVPGDVLASSADVTYLYNPDNCPDTTLGWLEGHPMRRHVLPDASHWASVDQPHAVADAILASIQS